MSFKLECIEHYLNFSVTLSYRHTIQINIYRFIDFSRELLGNSILVHVSYFQLFQIPHDWLNFPYWKLRVFFFFVNKLIIINSEIFHLQNENIWKGIPEGNKRTSKFPKLFMIWGCMSFKGVGEITVNTSTIDAMYIEILDNILIPSLEGWLGDDDVIFQHDKYLVTEQRRLGLFFTKDI